MVKILKIFGILLASSIMIPVMKTIMDIFTNPTNGILLSMGEVQGWVLAGDRLLPWVLWPAVIIWCLYIWFKKDEPKQTNFPRVIK